MIYRKTLIFQANFIRAIKFNLPKNPFSFENGFFISLILSSFDTFSTSYAQKNVGECRKLCRYILGTAQNKWCGVIVPNNFERNFI